MNPQESCQWTFQDWYLAMKPRRDPLKWTQAAKVRGVIVRRQRQPTWKQLVPIQGPTKIYLMRRPAYQCNIAGCSHWTYRKRWQAAKVTWVIVSQQRPPTWKRVVPIQGLTKLHLMRRTAYCWNVAGCLLWTYHKQ